MSIPLRAKRGCVKSETGAGGRYRAYGASLPARWEDRHALIVASVLELVDLKRAGFRYGHGELTIPTGEAVRSIQGPEPLSYCGSPAALCAQEADDPAIGLAAPRFPSPIGISLAKLASISTARRRTKRRRAR
jgi:hypothetical protein